jgi:hypothetical protein
MNTPQNELDALIDAVLQCPQTAEASPIIALIPGTSPQRFLCVGDKQDIIEALTSEFWKTAAAL